MNYLKKFLAITLIFVMQFQSVHASVAVGGGWGLNLIRVENSTSIFTAFKDGFQSTVAISPSSAQVAKSLLRGGLVGLALSAVTQVLEDGVDYLLDSANQQLKYTPKPIYQYDPNYYYPGVPGCSSSTITFKTLEEGMNWGYYCINWSIDHHYMIQKILDSTYNSITYLNVYNTKTTMTVRENKIVSQPKTIPLTTLATQIINLAEQGNPEAKAYIASVVQDMLEHDEDYRKSLEAQLDAKLKEATQTKTPDNCPSGIRNKNGDCWICSRESHDSIRGRVLNAKVPVEGLAQCEKSMNSSQLLTRYKAYSEFADAREAENRCWLPPDEHHITEAKNARNVANKCNDYLGILGKIR